MKNIQYVHLRRGEFLCHKGEKLNKMLICIKGQLLEWDRKDDSDLNREMEEYIRIQKYQEKLRQSENEIDRKYLLGKIEAAQTKLNSYRVQEEDDLLRSQFSRYFHLEHICKYKRIGYINQGAIIGEANLVSNSKMGSTIIANDDTHLVYLRGKDFFEIFALEQQKIMLILNALIKTFPKGNLDSLRRMAYDFEQSLYDINETIFRQGEPCEFLYVIKKGEVQTKKSVQVTDSDKVLPSSSSTFETQKSKRKKIREVNLAILGESQVLGYEDIIQKRSHSFSAVALKQDTILYFIKASRLQLILDMTEDWIFQAYLKKTASLKNQWITDRTTSLVQFQQMKIQ